MSVILIDGPNFCYRAHFVGKNLSSRGRPTGVLHVTLSMMASFGDIVQPAPIFFLWDAGPLWRKKVMAEYKAHRNHESEDSLAVYQQIPILQNFLHAMGVTQVQVPTLEADDLAGIFTKEALKRNRSVVLASGDRDWFQLLGPNVKQLRGWKGKKAEWFTSEHLVKEYGVTPELWPNYLALVGEKGDNIPKALKRGAGEKVALKVLRGEATLNAEEQQQYDINLSVTRILTEWDRKEIQKSISRVAQRTKSDWKAMEDILSEFELFKLWGERKRLWEVGSWK